MKKRERLEATLAGGPVDRVPVALWRHFPVDDQTPDGLAAATLDFQRAYDFDLVKVTPASSFCLRDWGAADAWRGATEGTRDYIHRPVQAPEDWLKLQPLDPYSGALGEQLACLALMQSAYAGETNPPPLVQTIFSPLAQAKNLVGREALLLHLRCYPEALHTGLKTIAESTRRFIEAACAQGIDGVFYAVQHASYHLLSEAEYTEFGRAYDLEVLPTAAPLWLNLLHLHGEAVMFDQVADYPVQVLNWHDRDTWPGLAEGQARFKGAVCGGLQREHTVVLGSPLSVTAEAHDAIQATGGRRFILGTGCVLPTIAPRANILAARRSVERA